MRRNWSFVEPQPTNSPSQTSSQPLVPPPQQSQPSQPTQSAQSSQSSTVNTFHIFCEIVHKELDQRRIRRTAYHEKLSSWYETMRQATILTTNNNRIMAKKPAQSTWIIYGEEAKRKMILYVGRNLETMLQEVGHMDNNNTVAIQQATAINDRYFNMVATESTNVSPLLSGQRQMITQHNNNINSNVYRSAETPSQISPPTNQERTMQVNSEIPDLTTSTEEMISQKVDTVILSAVRQENEAMTRSFARELSNAAQTLKTDAHAMLSRAEFLESEAQRMNDAVALVPDIRTRLLARARITRTPYSRPITPQPTRQQLATSPTIDNDDLGSSVDHSDRTVGYCSICMEHIDAEEVKTLECGHKFHIQCILHWQNRTAVCPNCRQAFQNI